MSTSGTNSERVPPSRQIGIKPLLAAVVIAELVIWTTMRSGVWQRTGSGWLFWAVNAALAVLVVLVPLAGWHWKPLLAAVVIAELIILHSGVWQKTGFGWQFWAVNATLVTLVVFLPLGGWHWARHRFRVSLKAFLTATLVIGAAFGGLAVIVERSRTQREAAAALMARGVGIEYAGTDEPGLRALVGVEYFESPVYLGTTLRLNDADWKHVEQLSGLESLAGAGVTDADLAHLRKLRQLSSLHLMNSNVTDEGLAQLGDLPRLTNLGLIRTKFTDGDLAALATCKRLTQLRLISTAVGDAGLRHVSRLKTLQELHLDSALVTDAGLAHLQSLPKLAVLHLRASITDDGLAQLKVLPALRRLGIEGCPVSDEAIEQFRRERPDVVVTH